MYIRKGSEEENVQNLMTPFGARLREERMRRQLSQEALAEELDVSPRSISRWEKGQILPQPSVRLLLSRFFGLPPEALFTDENKQIARETIWHVPYSRNPFFTGREEILHHLHEQLNREHSLALTQSWAISGLGGIGKTQIALEYAYRYRQDYRAVFWTTMASQEALLADVVTIAQLLQLPERKEQDQKKMLQAVKRWFATHQEWLWILDNADDLALIRDLMPTELPGHLLLTSRAQAWGSFAQRLDIESMGVAEGSLFLLRRARLLAPDAFLDQVAEEHLAAAEALVLEMEFFPLALDQAGAYIEEVGCTLSAYLKLYRTHRKELLQRRGSFPSDHPDSVITTWSLSFQHIAQINPAAAELLQVCAFLDPDAIPEEMISKGSASLGPTLGSAARDALKFNEMVEELRRFSLLQRSSETGTLRIHRLVQAVLKDAMEEPTRRQWAERVVRATNSVFPEDVDATLPRCRRYLPQAQSCSVLIQDYDLTFLEAASLLSRAVTYLHVYALNEQGEPLEKQALSIREELLGVDHPDVAISLNQLGLLYYEQGKYTQAEPLFQRALHIQEQAFGLHHPNVTTSLKHLAFLSYAQSKYEQAESLCRRVVRIRERALGPEHPDTASALNNLAIMCHAQGKYEQEEALFQQAAHIMEKALGPDHPRLAYMLSNLALIYYEQEKYEQAELLARRAWSIFAQALGSDDIAVTYPLNTLANICSAQGRNEQAESLFQQVLALRVQGRPQHADTAETLHDFALFQEAQGKTQEATSLYQRALTIREQIFGATNPETLSTRARYIRLLRTMGKLDEAQRVEDSVT